MEEELRKLRAQTEKAEIENKKLEEELNQFQAENEKAEIENRKLVAALKDAQEDKKLLKEAHGLISFKHQSRH